MSTNHRTLFWLLAPSLVLLASSAARAQTTPPNTDYKYALGNAPYSNAAPTSHNSIFPFKPVGFMQKVQPFGPADISDYGNGPKPKIGFFFNYNRLYWSIGKAPLATVGATGTQQFIENNFLVNEQSALDTNFIGGRFAPGNRYELGYMDTDNHGWLVSVVSHVRQNQHREFNASQVLFNNSANFLVPQFIKGTNGIDIDVNGNHVFGRDGQDFGTLIPGTVPPIFPSSFQLPYDNNPDLPALPILDPVRGLVVPPVGVDASGVDQGDRVIPLPQFTQVRLENHTNLNGVEVMRMFRAPRLHNGGNFELLYGARWFQVYDLFLFEGFGGPLADTFISTTIMNNIVGPQIGGRYTQQRGRWIFDGQARFLAGINIQNEHQRTELASQTLAQTVNNIRAYSTTAVMYHKAFSPLGEIRANTTYQLTKSFALTFGYTAIAVGGIARAADKVNYSLPGFGIKPGFDHQGLFIQGINGGFEFNR